MDTPSARQWWWYTSSSSKMEKRRLIGKTAANGRHHVCTSALFLLAYTHTFTHTHTLHTHCCWLRTVFSFSLQLLHLYSRMLPNSRFTSWIRMGKEGRKKWEIYRAVPSCAIVYMQKYFRRCYILYVVSLGFGKYMLHFPGSFFTVVVLFVRWVCTFPGSMTSIVCPLLLLFYSCAQKVRIRGLTLLITSYSKMSYWDFIYIHNI